MLDECPTNLGRYGHGMITVWSQYGHGGVTQLKEVLYKLQNKINTLLLTILLPHRDQTETIPS